MDVLRVLMLLASYFELCSALEASVALVNTTNGMVKGQVKLSVEGLYVQEFLGIPFAQAPIGHLRFANPIPAKSWNDTYSAEQYGESCYQFAYGIGIIGSEDCLYLNIWTPQPRPRNATVMVWIYGGGFSGGSSGSAAEDIYDGKVLVSRNDVIFVSMNYRLGALGFLATGDDRIQGNFGLLDQVLALEWIQRNIEAFGGDPDSVTIFGESAGAASVGYHVLSPVSRDLFKRAIMQSGSPSATWALMSHETARNRSSQFFKSVGCYDDQFVLQCLQNQSAVTPDHIVTRQTVDTRFLVISWAPIVDNYLIRDTQSNHLSQYNMKKMELLLGANKDEGNLFLALYGILPIVTLSDLAIALNAVDFDIPLDVREVIFNKYTRQLNISEHTTVQGALDEIEGDRSFVCPVVNFADTNVALGLQTYLYSLEYRASNAVTPEWMGVIHTDDLQWVFGWPMNRSRGYTDEEVFLSERIMTYWTNFAKYGDPNGDQSELTGLPNWPLYNHANEYLSIDGARRLSRQPLLKRCKCKLWKIIDSLSSYE